jgi:glycerophosphoryl diester phosphodiesterase
MLVFGHRGAKAEAPENTVAGFRYAHSTRLRAVEFDVRLTRDERLVVIHDKTVDRTTDGTGAVAELTWRRIAGLDARGAFTQWPEHCGVPTLRVALEATVDFDELAIEIKADHPRRLGRLIPKLVREIRRQRADARVVLTSFDITALALAREVAPELPRAYIGNWDSPAALTVARLLECRQADVHLSTASPEIVAAAQAAGMRVVGWPCNTESECASLAAWGVDAVTTDVPSRFVSRS